MKSILFHTLAGLFVLAAYLGIGENAQAQHQYYNYQLQRFYYYPYYFYPHNYWPTMGPRYPERPGQPYRLPPAYMAYPPFREPTWRYEYWQNKRFYGGHHFWLDQF